MYWDGAVADGIAPDVGILIASNHPQSALDMVTMTNGMSDANGNPYNFVAKTWKDESADYPAAP